MKKEQYSVDDWKFYASADLDSACLLQAKGANFHVVVYLCHQSAEKVIKWFLLKKNCEFPFSHDLRALLSLVNQFKPSEHKLKDIVYLMDLYQGCRYPHGDRIEQLDSERAIQIVQDLFQWVVA